MAEDSDDSGKPKQKYQLRNTFMTVLENPSPGNKHPFYVRYPTLRNAEKLDDRMSCGPCDGLFYVPWNCIMVDDMLDRMGRPHYLYPEDYVELEEDPPQVKTYGAIYGVMNGPLMNIVMHATTVRNYSFNSCPEGSDRQNNTVQLLYNAGNYSLLVLFLDLF